MWAAFSTDIQDLYFQGLTDIFELFFAAFIDTELLNGLIDTITEEEYELFSLESILPNKEEVINYGI